MSAPQVWMPADIKLKPLGNEYLEIIRRLTPEQRALKSVEITESLKVNLKGALKRKFPDKSEIELHDIFLRRLEQCHNQNY